MRACIVGNGSSVYNSWMGEYIDGMDIVIRMHEFKNTYPADFGKKYDYGILPAPWLSEAREQITMVPDEGWLLYSFGKHKKYLNVKEVEGRQVHHFNIDDTFHEIFKTGKAPTMGLAAVLMTAIHLKPKEIYLAGFDSVANGKITQYHELSGILESDEFIGKSENNRHNYAYENKMVGVISDKFGIKIKYLWGAYDDSYI